MNKKIIIVTIMAIVVPFMHTTFLVYDQKLLASSLAGILTGIASVTISDFFE